MGRQDTALAVWTWGANNYEQLTNRDGASNAPGPISKPLPAAINVVSAGGWHTVALLDDGSVWAWGANGYGQLGDGTNQQRSEPVQVVGLERVTAISAGGFHTLALVEDGTVWSWGANGWGQLGNGTNQHSNRPVQVAELGNVVGVSAGGGHSLALLGDGTVHAWGLQDWYQLGNSTWQNSTKPKDVLKLQDVWVDWAGDAAQAPSIAAGPWHSSALLANGTVRCWGANNYGQLGNGMTRGNTYEPPVQPSNLKDITAVAVGSHHSLALARNGTVWAWGYNGYGQLGNGTNQDARQPVQVDGLENIKAISAGMVDMLAGNASHYSLALREDGTVWAWGINDWGQLGDGTNQHRNRPVQARGIEASLISAGGWHNVAYGWALTEARSGRARQAVPA